METMHETVPLAEGALLEGHVIERLLARGRYGYSYVARDGAGRDCRIREFLPHEFAERIDGVIRARDPDDRNSLRFWMRAFLEKSAQVGRLAHPALPQVLRQFEANGSAYEVSVHAPGRSLDTLLDTDGTLSEPVLLRLLGGVAGALEVAHGAGLLHRNLGLQNIWLRDSDGNTCLQDFGVLRAPLRLKSRSLLSHALPPYSAPEDELPNPVQSPASDIYGLGVIAWRALTGVMPPPAFERQRGASLPRLADVARVPCSENLVRAVEAALALAPERRPRSVADLRAAMRGQPAEAPRRAAPAIAAAAPATPAPLPTAPKARPFDTTRNSTTTVGSMPNSMTSPPADSKTGSPIGSTPGPTAPAPRPIGATTNSTTASAAGSTPSLTTNASASATTAAPRRRSSTGPKRYLLPAIALGGVGFIGYLLAPKAPAARPAPTEAAAPPAVAEPAPVEPGAPLAAEPAAALAASETAAPAAPAAKTVVPAALPHGDRPANAIGADTARAGDNRASAASTARDRETLAARRATAPAAASAHAAAAIAPAVSAAAAAPAPEAAAAEARAQALELEVARLRADSEARKRAQAEDEARARAQAAAENQARLKAAEAERARAVQVIAAARRNCVLPAMELSEANNLTYDNALSAPGARKTASGAIRLPPVELNDGTTAVYEITPDSCARRVR